jgi:hypothetical protein
LADRRRPRHVGFTSKLRKYCCTSPTDSMCHQTRTGAIGGATRFRVTKRYASRTDQSGFAPENFTALAHFSVSAAIKAPTAVLNGIGVLPSSASRALIFGSARPALISVFNFATIQWVWSWARRHQGKSSPRSPARNRPPLGRPAAPASASQSSLLARGACRPATSGAMVGGDQREGARYGSMPDLQIRGRGN